MVKVNLALFEDIITPFVITEKGQRAGFALAFVMGALLFVAVIHMLFAWRADFVISRDGVPARDVASVSDLETKLIGELPTEHLFGVQLAEDADFLPITSLRLRLTGILQSSEADRSKAIISEASQSGKVYAVGDLLVSGIKIYAINADGVVLEHGGRLEKLPLVRSQLSFQDKPKSLWRG